MSRRWALTSARTEANNVRREVFGFVEIKPVVLLQQLEGELELVAERQAVD